MNDFWINITSGAIGSFLGVVGAFAIQIYVFKREKVSKLEEFDKYFITIEPIYNGVCYRFYKFQECHDYNEFIYYDNLISMIGRFIGKLQEIPKEVIPYEIHIKIRKVLNYASQLQLEVVNIKEFCSVANFNTDKKEIEKAFQKMITEFAKIQIETNKVRK